jgi:hypothetical protein
MTHRGQQLALWMVAGGLLLATTIGASFNPGRNTPVVLVGGSLTFKAADRNYAWQPDPAAPTKQYYVSPNYKVAIIVIKARAVSDTGDDPVGDDSDPTTDGPSPADVSGATSWEVDAFTNTSVTPIASIFSPVSGSNIDLVLNSGYFCNETSKRLKYGTNQQCSDPREKIKFSKVQVLVNDQVVRTIKCVDDNHKKGTCRIVLREAE